MTPMGPSRKPSATPPHELPPFFSTIIPEISPIPDQITSSSAITSIGLPALWSNCLVLQIPDPTFEVGDSFICTNAASRLSLHDRQNAVGLIG